MQRFAHTIEVRLSILVRPMRDVSATPHSANSTRMRAMVIPREHGAWGLLLVPLFTGAAVGIASQHRIWPVVLFTLAALTLFWLRTPMESLLGTTPLKAQTAAERKLVFMASLALAAVSAGCLAGLLWNGHNRGLLLLGGVATLAFVVQALLKKLSRKTRTAAQLVGAIALTCTAPGAYYAAGGRLQLRAVVLWAANWIFAGDQIHFVQLRIHAARAATFREKWTVGWAFFLIQITLLPILATAWRWHFIPALVILAFVPVLVRGISWFFRGPESLQIRSLGWSEMKQGILFGILLAAALILS